jgi:flagellar biosynthesis anti-sigma factor FlgM
MKIDNRSDAGAISTPGTTGAAGVDSGARNTTTGVAGGSSSDSVELSGLAGQISQAESQNAASRSATVEQLRSEVSNGTYQADPAAISHGVVNEALAAAAAGGSSGR